MLRQRNSIFIFLAAALLGPGAALAAPTQAFEKTSEICLEQTRVLERERHIPRHLLGAIALAETGRWDEERRANFAWPWTVTAGGKGKYFETKQQAISEVRRLRSKGRTNIDVGCMQINLHYHPQAFKNLDQAFDPAVNVAYAADFLQSRYADSRSWVDAAASYHSTTPQLKRAYKIKILGLWKRQRQYTAANTVTQAPDEPHLDDKAALRPEPPSHLVDIDHDWSAELNNSFRDRRAKQQNLNLAEKRHNQINAWRQSRFQGVHTSTIQRIEKEVLRKQRQMGLLGTDRDNSFAAKRRQQLESWRQSRI